MKKRSLAVLLAILVVSVIQMAITVDAQSDYIDWSLADLRNLAYRSSDMFDKNVNGYASMFHVS